MDKHVAKGNLILPKVFGIGFHKTATTSLKLALEHLGYRVSGPDGVNDPDIATRVIDLVEQRAARFDAFQDNPWPIVYRHLDERFPGSRFILTIRPVEKWIASQLRHFGEAETPMRRWIYGDHAGSPAGNEAIYTARYNQHNAEVMAYFRDRPDDLLVMDVTAGDGWEKLCPFLGRPVPSIGFPHANKGSARDRMRRRRAFWRRVRGAFGGLFKRS